ncbi:MAG: c-type cytochrome [Anaerolineales bacterium]|nr:c-type cytochrome [Anaerolineales bacterium]
MPMHLRRPLAALFVAAAALLSACSLAGDVTPPPGQGTVSTSLPVGATVPPQTPAAPTLEPTTRPADVGYPAAAPAARDGGPLFLEHCASCHGAGGQGDGEMSAQLPAPPPNLTDPAFTHSRSPLSLFTAITQGNLDALMPPFGDSLTEAQRWRLAAYVTTLSTPPEQLALGQTIYAAQCAACHGATGQGDGPNAAALGRPMPNFTDQAVMVLRTGDDLRAVIAGGDALHPFAEALSADEQWAVAAAVRAFGYVYAAPSSAPAERTGRVSGTVVNGTAGGTVPAGLELNLHSFDTTSLIDTFTTTVRTDGTFDFGAVAYAPGRQFLVSTVYDEVTYGSEVASFDAAGAPLALTLPIYEKTSDPAAIRVSQMHMFLEFQTATAVTIGELFIFSNSGDRTYAASGADLLQFNLPAGATDLNVQNAVLDQDYFRNADGFGALWQISPGEGGGQLLVSYRLPYDGGLNFSQVMHYPVAGVNVLLSDLGVKLDGPNVLYLGPETFQGQTFQNFNRAGLSAGESLTFDLSGTAGTGTTTPASGGSALGLTTTTTTTGLAVGIGAVAVALLGIGVWLYRRPQPVDPSVRREELLQALAELDAVYAAGDVAQADYLADRAALKAELQAVWKAGR